MRELRSAYRSGLAPSIEALRMAASSLATNAPGAYESIRRLAHQLNGSGASYGFPEITDCAAAVLAAEPAQVAAPLEDLIAVTETVAAGSEAAATVLVVDDEPIMRHLLEATLTARGHEVRSAGSMAGATSQLTPDIAVIVLDLFLPDGDGRRFLLELRRLPDYAAIPVVMISAGGTQLAKAECLALGARAFIDKPFDPRHLAATVEEILADAAPPPEAVPVVTPGESSNGRRRILVAEDDELTAALVIDRLQREGHEVVHRRDGSAALAAARDEAVGLAILDVKMPRMDGFELLRQLRELDGFENVPILMLTSMGNEHDVVRGFSLGADDYILKPFSPSELTARVTRLLERA